MRFGSTLPSRLWGFFLNDTITYSVNKFFYTRNLIDYKSYYKYLTLVKYNNKQIIGKLTLQEVSVTTVGLAFSYFITITTTISTPWDRTTIRR